MHSIRILLSVAWYPLLGGCMMMGGMRGGMGGTGYAEGGQMASVPLSAEARNDDLTIALSLSPPSSPALASIGARLHSESDRRDLADASVSLRIRTPSGAVDELLMQRVRPEADIFQAQYGFRTAGTYQITAEGQTGAGGYMVSVSLEAEVAGRAHLGQGDWRTPTTIVGGLAMVAMMALMMGNVVF